MSRSLSSRPRSSACIAPGEPICASADDAAARLRFRRAFQNVRERRDRSRRSQVAGAPHRLERHGLIIGADQRHELERVCARETRDGAFQNGAQLGVARPHEMRNQRLQRRRLELREQRHQILLRRLELRVFQRIEQLIERGRIAYAIRRVPQPPLVRRQHSFCA